MTSFPRLLFLAGTQDFPNQPAFERLLRDLISSGLPWFQLREKNLDDRSLYLLAEKVRMWTQESGCLFTINDRPDIALLTGADGVHLGQTDLSALEPEFIRPRREFHVGISTHDAHEVRRALTVKPDYLGVGPIFGTLTKETGIPPRGLQALSETRELSSLPLVAIGGITLDKVPGILQSGECTIAVSGSMTRAEDPRKILASYLKVLT